jgi:hypothetical protein
MAYRLAAIGLAAVMASIGLVGDAWAYSQDEAERRLTNELRFRAAFGLATDGGFVRQLIRDSGSDTAYGVAMTPPERIEMDRRVAMQDAMTALEVYAEAQPGFAGHWIDQQAGGVITVAFTAGSGTSVSALTARLPRNAKLRVVEVERSLASLEALEDEIRRDVRKLSEDGISVRHHFVDIPGNRVVVGVPDPDGAAGKLEARYGDRVVPEYSNPVSTACTGKESCFGPPLRAGISVAPPGTSIGNRCSMGFMVKQGTNVQWLTAGHCAKTVGVTFAHAGNPNWVIGTIKATCWPNCLYSDAARGGNINSTFASNHVFRNNATWPVAAVQPRNADDVGDVTCLNARKNNSIRCGTITSIGSICYTGNPTVCFDEMRFANYSSAFGDSGGAVHSAFVNPGVTAYGGHSGCTNLAGDGTCIGRGVYSHIARITQELGVSVCRTGNSCT